MEIRKFDMSDFNTAAQICRAGMELDSMPDFLLEEKILNDPDLDPVLTYIAYEGEKPVGFIMGVIRKRETGSTGYIKLLCVLPEFRRKGIASEMYNRVESEIRSRGVKSIRVYESYPNYYMPGIDPFYTEAVCFFERNKFKKIGDTSNLAADLEQDFSTSEEEKELLGRGIVCRRPVKEDFGLLIKWTEKNFKAWIGEITAAFNNDPISLHIAELNGEIIAFSAYDSNNIGIGWFGPMGTTEAARGKGVGGILLKRCLEDQKKQGHKISIIPWVGPIPFYMHYANSKVMRVFWRYEKILE